MQLTKVAGVTLRVGSMAAALHFYRDTLGLKLLFGDENTTFCCFDVNGTYLNLELSGVVETTWGRLIFYCDDVDEVHSHLRSRGIHASEPRDASWGERFFHVADPDGHEISIAKMLKGNQGQSTGSAAGPG